MIVSTPHNVNSLAYSMFPPEHNRRGTVQCSGNTNSDYAGKYLYSKLKWAMMKLCHNALAILYLLLHMQVKICLIQQWQGITGELRLGLVNCDGIWIKPIGISHYTVHRRYMITARVLG